MPRDVDAVVPYAWAHRAPGVPIVYWGRSLGTAMAAYAATVRPPDRIVLEAGFPDAATPVESHGIRHGIPGMRERAQLAGGTLTADAGADGTFRVRARIPAQPVRTA